MAAYENDTTALVVFAKGDIQEELAETKAKSMVASNEDAKKAANKELTLKGLKRKYLKKGTIGGGIYRASKSVINYCKNNYGAIHQDSLAQARINETMSIIGKGATIGVSFVAGGMVGGFVALGSEVLSDTLQAITYNRNINRSNVVSQVNMYRVGNSALNGGR